MFWKKRRVADPFYVGIQKNQLGLYQKYIDALITLIDIDNYTRWSGFMNYDQEKLDRENKLIERVCREQAAGHGLSPDFLQTMLYQYIFAEPWLRENYGSTWVKTVVYNKDRLAFLPYAQKARRFWKR